MPANISRYGLYPCSLMTGSQKDFKQILGVGIRHGKNQQNFIPSGRLGPNANFLNFIDPTILVRTGDIDQLFAQLQITTGLNCSLGGLFRYQQRADGGTFKTGADHIVITSNKGFAYVDSLTCTQDVPAEAVMGYRVLFDGTNRPLKMQINQALSTPKPGYNSVFWLGPISYNSVLIDTIRSVDIRPGLVLNVFREDGDNCARRCYVVSYQPRITFTMARLDFIQSGLADYFMCPLTPAGGESGEFRPLRIYLRRGIDGGDRYADTENQHFKLTVNDGSWGPEEINAQNADDAIVTFSVVPKETMSGQTINPAMTVATNSPIPTS